jgi:hypothetical protein
MQINPNRLHMLVDRAFDWIMSNLEFFDPFNNVTNHDKFLLANKPLLELSVLCMLYYQREGSNPDPRAQKFVSFIHDIWKKPNYSERVVRNPNVFRIFPMVYIALQHCGSLDHSYDEIIQRILDQGYATAVEQIPFRGMDLRHMLDKGGFKHNVPSFNQLYQMSLLAKTPSVIYLTNEDVYCITHTLFYLGDFGLRPIDVIPEEQLPTIHWMIDTLLGIYLCMKDWDLVAELLLCCQCLRWYSSIIFSIAFNALLDAQLLDGSVPGPMFSKDEMQNLDESERKIYCFNQNYHTTLVSALTCFLSDQWIINLDRATNCIDSI